MMGARSERRGPCARVQNMPRPPGWGGWGRTRLNERGIEMQRSDQSMPSRNPDICSQMKWHRGAIQLFANGRTRAAEFAQGGCVKAQPGEGSRDGMIVNGRAWDRAGCR
eukprot:scaffold43322_cov28-Tisochrysis_lutea.AAC.6